MVEKTLDGTDEGKVTPQHSCTPKTFIAKDKKLHCTRAFTKGKRCQKLQKSKLARVSSVATQRGGWRIPRCGKVIVPHTAPKMASSRRVQARMMWIFIGVTRHVTNFQRKDFPRRCPAAESVQHVHWAGQKSHEATTVYPSHKVASTSASQSQTSPQSASMSAPLCQQPRSSHHIRG